MIAISLLYLSYIQLKKTEKMIKEREREMRKENLFKLSLHISFIYSSNTKRGIIKDTLANNEENNQQNSSNPYSFPHASLPRIYQRAIRGASLIN